VRKLLALPLLALAVAAPAGAFVKPVTKRANLDEDSFKETIRVRPIGPEGGFQRTEVSIADSCPAAVDRRVMPVHDNLELLRLWRVDRRKGYEVFVVMRDGARSALGEARLISWRPRAGQQCRAARTLFDYDTDRHTRTPAGGTGDIALFNARLRNVTSRYRGPEIVIDERFSAASDPPNFGSLKKVTYWRYSPKRDRFVHYRTLTRRLSPS
jgi:hypothetical protein